MIRHLDKRVNFTFEGLRQAVQLRKKYFPKNIGIKWKRLPIIASVGDVIRKFRCFGMGARLGIRFDKAIPLPDSFHI